MKTYQKLLLIILVLLLTLGAVPFAAMPTYAEAKELTPMVRLESDTTALSQNLLRIKVNLDGDKLYGISGEWSYSNNLTLLKEESKRLDAGAERGRVLPLWDDSP